MVPDLSICPSLHHHRKKEKLWQQLLVFRRPRRPQLPHKKKEGNKTFIRNGGQSSLNIKEEKI
jgi:hypothetical protein